jgi:predicted Zn-dependent peptidase
MSLIYREKLSNGLRIVVEEIPFVRSVSLGIWVGTGSRDEEPSNNGMSHFLEHMLFKGTDTRNAKQIAELFDGIGGQVNAFTSKEYTCFYAKVLDEHFELALSTLADMLFHSLFLEEEVNKERKVIIEEIKMYEDAPDELVHDLIGETVYPSHPLGYSILGTEQNLNSFTREDILQYIQNHYTPDNIVLAVAGNVRMSQVLPIATKLFAGASGTRKRFQMQPPKFARNVQVRNKATEQAHLILATECYAFHDPRVYPLILLNNVLGGSSSSRLFQEIREERGMAYSVYSYYTAYRDTGLFGIYAGTSPDQAQQVIDLCAKILNDIVENGITGDELMKAKEQVKGSLMLSLESTSARMSRLGKNELLLGRQVSLDETLEKINNVTLDHIKDVATDMFDHTLALAAVGPFDQLAVPGAVS